MDIKANKNIVIADPANNDLKIIYNYILKMSCSADIATHNIKRIIDSISTLDYMPERYHLYPNEPWHSLGIRYFVINKYKIFYKYKKKEDQIVILRILHSSQESEEQLNLYKADMVADSHNVVDEYEKTIKKIQKENKKRK